MCSTGVDQVMIFFQVFLDTIKISKHCSSADITFSSMFEQKINDIHLTSLSGCLNGCFAPRGFNIDQGWIFLKQIFYHAKIAMGVTNELIDDFR